MKTIKDIDIAGKNVLLRADYNVPLDESGAITDDYRIKQAIPTLKYLLEQDCRVVIISHLGRPEGERNPKYSMRPVAERLEELVDREVALADDVDTVDSQENQITLLENLRFWPEETGNDSDFAKKLAGLGEVFVQDGFGVVHRAHASTDAVTRHMDQNVAGLLLAREIEVITNAMENPERPLVAIFGGAKISDKIGVIERFIDKADKILIGGAMANTFFAYSGNNVGKSLYESKQSEVIDKLLHKVLEKEDTDCKACKDLSSHGDLLAAQHTIELPSDVAVANSVDDTQRRVIVETDKVADDEYILDIGTDTIKNYQNILSQAGTVIWNGPLGYTELDEFANGSNHIAATLKEHKDSIETIIGGGDTAGFIVHWDPDKGDSFTHISTGGGAALDLMAGEKLPGVEALSS